MADFPPKLPDDLAEVAENARQWLDVYSRVTNHDTSRAGQTVWPTSESFPLLVQAAKWDILFALDGELLSEIAEGRKEYAAPYVPRMGFAFHSLKIEVPTFQSATHCMLELLGEIEHIAQNIDLVLEGQERNKERFDPMSSLHFQYMLGRLANMPWIDTQAILAEVIRELFAADTVRRKKAPWTTLGTTPTEQPRCDDNERLTVPQIAERYRLDEQQKRALSAKLGRWRRGASIADYGELQEHAKNQPKYLYRVGAIRHLLG